MTKTLHCSFCGKSEREIRKLAAGPGGVHICNECVAACEVIMQGEADGFSRSFDPKTWPPDRLLALLAPVNSTIDSYRAHLQDIVGALREKEVSWAVIGEKLGVSRQTAWERFS